jgi:hypothetical protein
MYDKYSDEAIQADARKRLQDLLTRKSFAERWAPVARELLWIIHGKPDQLGHKNLLPDYCYNILELQKRTVYKAMPTFPEVISVDKDKVATCKTPGEAKPFTKINHDQLGAVVGVGLGGGNFFAHGLEKVLQKEGVSDLTPQEISEIGKYLGLQRCEQNKTAAQALDPRKPIEELLEKPPKESGQQTGDSVSLYQLMALVSGTEQTALLHQGIAKGVSGFVNDEGDLVGASKLKLGQTYDFLLVMWPEIDAMLKANPPKRMEDLWDWLTPFSHAGWIEIKDLDQLVSLCRPINLKLKKPGAPRKPLEC